MKVVQLYNEQRSEFGGEISAISNTANVLRAHGHEVIMAVRSSRGIENSMLRKIHAGIAGIYSFSAVSEIHDLVARERPDIIHAHGVYPLWSPSIFPACRKMGMPSLLHVHCHYLTCPTWYHLRNSQICNRCFNGKEHWCLLTNCRNNYAESAAYALRSAAARKLRLFADNVGVFIAVSDFLKERLIQGGYPAERIRVVRNVVPYGDKSFERSSNSGEYIGYCGRLSREKGVHTLIEAARQTGLPVQIAGDGLDRTELERSAPGNVQFLGYLRSDALSEFYENCRFIVMPSLSYEGLPLAAAESMMHGRPVIASRIGAIPEVVLEGRTGLLFQAGNVAELSALMTSLWWDSELCEHYGRTAREVAAAQYGEREYYSRLMGAYESAKTFARETTQKVSMFAITTAVPALEARFKRDCENKPILGPTCSSTFSDRVRPERIQLLGVGVDNVTMDEAIGEIVLGIDRHDYCYAVTPNVDHLMRQRHDEGLRIAYGNARFSFADGVPLLWAAALLGSPLKERVNGTDLFEKLCETAEARHYSIYLLGGNPGVADRAARTLQTRHPRLAVAGSECPPFGFEKDRETCTAIQKRIASASADILFVGLGSPKQEEWICQYGKGTGVAFAIGIGVSFSFVAAEISRAPVWMQKSGLEWMWRLLKEPKRLWRRYLMDDVLFIPLVLRAWTARILS